MKSLPCACAAARVRLDNWARADTRDAHACFDTAVATIKIRGCKGIRSKQADVRVTYR
jgi:hypothetical protein